MSELRSHNDTTASQSDARRITLGLKNGGFVFISLTFRGVLQVKYASKMLLLAENELQCFVDGG